MLSNTVPLEFLCYSGKFHQSFAKMTRLWLYRSLTSVSQWEPLKQVRKTYRKMAKHKRVCVLKQKCRNTFAWCSSTSVCQLLAAEADGATRNASLRSLPHVQRSWHNIWVKPVLVGFRYNTAKQQNIKKKEKRSNNSWGLSENIKYLTNDASS